VERGEHGRILPLMEVTEALKEDEEEEPTMSSTSSSIISKRKNLIHRRLMN